MTDKSTCDELAEALKDCTDDLEEHVNNYYRASNKEYPDIERKFVRDMKPVRRAREVLSRYEAEKALNNARGS
jgi:hypothetical protein